MLTTKKYKPYTLRNFRDIPQVAALPEEEKFNIEVVGNVFPFKTNNYVVEELIDWSRVPEDPIYVLNFPQKGMLKPGHFGRMAETIKAGSDSKQIRKVADEIRWQLNPHPAGQMEKNVPTNENGEPIQGIQHKYRETVLFFPSQGQTCHAYCTFCFRWPQFVGIEELKFSSKEAGALVDYLRRHEEVTDVLITGGDPLVMRAKTISAYIDAILDAGLDHIRTIRFGTKSLAYWPYRFLTDEDSGELLRALAKVKASGRHLAIMAHFNHPQELRTDAVKRAITALKSIGAEIRTQSPLLRHINDNPETWAEMWQEQVTLGLIPYYMFMVRDTGAQPFFGVPLVEAHNTFSEAFQQVSGVARTVRGPSMSAEPGKVMMNGVVEVHGREYIMLEMIQGRKPGWVKKPFFAEYDEQALWLDDLVPAFGEPRFFFEEKPQPTYRRLFALK